MSGWYGLVMIAAVLAEGEPGASTTTVAAAEIQAQPPPASDLGGLRLARGAEVEIELAEELSSKTSKPGQTFAIRLAAPIINGERVVAPAGAVGEGEIIDARGAGINGREGKLTISARHLDINGRRVRIRGMSMMASGQSRVGLAFGVSVLPYVGPASILVRGGDIVFPAGTRGTARVVADVDLSEPQAPSIGGN